MRRYDLGESLSNNPVSSLRQSIRLGIVRCGLQVIYVVLAGEVSDDVIQKVGPSVANQFQRVPKPHHDSFEYEPG